MATQLALEEQEQIDQLKAFWKRWGNALTWLVILVLAGLAAWNAWGWWQRDQASKAGAMFDQLDRAAQAGDEAQAGRVFADLRERYPRTTFAEQGGLAAARVQFAKGQLDAAVASLDWVGEHAGQREYQTVARLRAAGILMDQKKMDEAAKRLDGASAPEFAALVDDRRGDLLNASGKADDAKAAYTRAWQAMDPKLEYRRLIEAKLVALGAPLPASAAAPAPAPAGSAK